MLKCEFFTLTFQQVVSSHRQPSPAGYSYRNIQDLCLEHLTVGSHGTHH